MIELTEQPIDTNRLLEAVSDPHCGAQVLFVGTTRQWTRITDSETMDTVSDKPLLETDFLIYEAYSEMAFKQLERLSNQAKEKWPVKKVAIVHRLGRVAPEEASVAIAVSCPHRSEAFEAGQWLIDTIKHEVPIWKQEHYVQNGAEWIHPTSGSCRCDSKSPSIENAPTDPAEPELPSHQCSAGSKLEVTPSQTRQ